VLLRATGFLEERSEGVTALSAVGVGDASDVAVGAAAGGSRAGTAFGVSTGAFEAATSAVVASGVLDDVERVAKAMLAPTISAAAPVPSTASKIERLALRP
jgi:hypothetical protein